MKRRPSAQARARTLAARRGWETRRENARAAEREAKRAAREAKKRTAERAAKKQAKARSAAAKRGWETRKRNAVLASLQKTAKARSRARAKEHAAHRAKRGLPPTKLKGAKRAKASEKLLRYRLGDPQIATLSARPVPGVHSGQDARVDWYRLREMQRSDDPSWQEFLDYSLDLGFDSYEAADEWFSPDW